MNKITIICDSYKITGPRQSDGSISMTFTTGEYQYQEVSKLLTLNNNSVIKLTVENEDE